MAIRGLFFLVSIRFFRLGALRAEQLKVTRGGTIEGDANPYSNLSMAGNAFPAFFAVKVRVTFSSLV